MNQTSGFYSLHGAAEWAGAPTASSGGFTDGNPRAVWNSRHDEVDAYDELFASTTNLMGKMDLNSRGLEVSMTSQPLGSASMRSWPQQDWPATTQRGRPGWVTDRKGVRLQRRQQKRPAAAAQRHGVRKSPSQSQRASYGHSQLALYLGRIEWLDPVRELAGNTPASGGCGLQVATCWEAGSITNMKQEAVVAAGDDTMAWEDAQEEHMDDSATTAAAAVLCSDNTDSLFGSEPRVEGVRTWSELAWAPLKDGTLAWQDPWTWFFDELDPACRGNLTEPPLEWLPMHDGTHAWQDPLQWRRERIPDIIEAQYDDDDDY
ncbi:hypothetical protein BBO_05796 [Beauveria brongniartii RCEF 3172]|uniref:Uncharacterized protein n=1 Tax=Beauveria brongniartii RCEF 3172 TaxID=1081107 RepID=A0A167C3T3_9HYPO|nr:hypothetical protein BBO_05796 [Beauveria brongniartii RCEF 3172]